QLPTAGVCPLPNHRQHDAWNKARNCLLISSDKEEGHVLSIKENPEPGPDHRLAIRRIGYSDPRLDRPVVRVNLIAEACLKVISQAVIEAQLITHPPLILGKETLVAVIEAESVLVLQLWRKGVRPVLCIQRVGIVKREPAIHITRSRQGRTIKCSSHSSKEWRKRAWRAWKRRE